MKITPIITRQRAFLYYCKFIFGSQNLNNHKFFKKVIHSKSSNFHVDFIGFSDKFYKLPTNGPIKSRQKLWFLGFFASSTISFRDLTLKMLM